MTTIASSHLENRDRISDCLDKIMLSSKHLLSLVNEVLDMSKIESGKLELSEENFNLSDLMQNILTVIRPSLQAKQHKLEFQIAKVKHDEVIGDISRLQQAFLNILGNAIKYSDGDLQITLYGNGEMVFSNHASGLDEVQAGKLFERFYTVHTARKSTGLGLSIAKQLTEQMGGTIGLSYRESVLSIHLFFPIISE